jgi:hypothetical protein
MGKKDVEYLRKRGGQHTILSSYPYTPI